MPDNKFQYNEIFDSTAPILTDTPKDGDGFINRAVIEETIINLKSSFEKDYDRVKSLLPLLFDNDVENYGSNVTKVFNDWGDEGGGPSLAALAAHSIEQFNLDINQPIVSGLFVAAVLAEIPNNMQYHGNEHYRKVLFHTIRLITKNNEFHKDGTLHLGKSNITMLLISACIHDLGHQGGDNQRDGFYTPGAMEQQSFDLAKPFFIALDMDEEHIEQIETLVFCTDITFFAGDNSPCVRMKQIFKLYIWGQDKKNIEMMIVGKLRHFYENHKLVNMAMILHEADVGTSAGMSYEQTIFETINFMEERGVDNAGPNVVIAFLRDQLGETMFTEAAKQTFGPVMAEVIKKAEEDLKNGRDSFYDN